MIKFFDAYNNMIYDSQNCANTRIAYNDTELKAIFENARNGVVYNVGDFKLPSFINKTNMQRNLLTAELYYLKRTDPTNKRINEIEAILSPPQTDETEQENIDQNGDSLEIGFSKLGDN